MKLSLARTFPQALYNKCKTNPDTNTIFNRDCSLLYSMTEITDDGIIYIVLHYFR